ncbi:MAG: ribonuclease HII [Epsilonproteobacteria bacterium]|nr:ribonuclease HII [Campylobacterota bacterium]
MRHKNDTLFCYETQQNSIICGIDEAGRGPIAGPLVVVGVILKKSVKNLTDSKKIGKKKREEIFEKLQIASKYYIYEASAQKIDNKGLSFCLKEALTQIKDFFGKNVTYIFDGNSSFGVENIHPIVKADSFIDEVSAASIIAKVYRDRKMEELSKLYPNYKFEKHKGYGTKEHIEAIKKFGMCEIHRKSFRVKSLQLQLF